MPAGFHFRPVSQHLDPVTAAVNPPMDLVGSLNPAHRLYRAFTKKIYQEHYDSITILSTVNPKILTNRDPPLGMSPDSTLV